MRFHSLILVPLVLAACSPPADPPASSVNEIVIPHDEPADPAALLPIGADADLGMLKGELRCSFADADGKPLLIAAANVDRQGRATAIVNIATGIAPLGGSETGGFNALLKGGRFEAAGLTATIARGANQPTGDESSRHQATLTVTWANSQTDTRQGVWSCGP